MDSWCDKQDWLESCVIEDQYQRCFSDFSVTLFFTCKYLGYRLWPVSWDNWSQHLGTNLWLNFLRQHWDWYQTGKAKNTQDSRQFGSPNVVTAHVCLGLNKLILFLSPGDKIKWDKTSLDIIFIPLRVKTSCTRFNLSILILKQSIYLRNSEKN